MAEKKDNHILIKKGQPEKHGEPALQKNQKLILRFPEHLRGRPMSENDLIDLSRFLKRKRVYGKVVLICENGVMKLYQLQQTVLLSRGIDFDVDD